MPKHVMMDDQSYHLRFAARLAAAAIALGGGLVLLGWALKSAYLKSIVPGWTAMNPATALTFVITAACLGLQTLVVPGWRIRLLRTIFGVGVFATGCLVLCGFIFDWQVRLDRMLFFSDLGENRMAPNTAACFALIGVALLTLKSGPLGTRASQSLALLILAAAQMSILGYGYGAKNLYGIGNYIPMALNTAILFTFTSIGLLCVYGQRSVLAILIGPHSGSAVARRLLPIAIIAPSVLGFFRILGQNAGFYDTEFGAALMVLVTVVLLVTAIGVTAIALNRTDTARRQAEQEIRRLNESLERRVAERTAELAEVNCDLLQKNQENEMFVYSVSHDLRSPLVNLEGFSQELTLVASELGELLSIPEVPAHVKDRARLLLTKDMAESTRFIRHAVQRLSNIIDALLRLSRAGRVEYQSQDVDLNRILEVVVDALQSTITERGVAVSMSTMPIVHGDPTAIEQVFGNLISNALKYLDPGRPGRIELGCCPAAQDSQDQGSTLYVKDNGLGISAAYYEKIFQPFQRVHVNVAPGEGMGLAIVRRIVERHQGKIWVESTEGIGTTFFIQLPIAQPVIAVHGSTEISLKQPPVKEPTTCTMSL